jgi:predicted RecA/RadA family phage recombinase
MKNYVQPGSTITATAPAGGISSGVGLQVNNLFGVAAYSADAGAEVEIETVGVFDLAKDDAAFAIGDKVYWNPDNKEVTDTSSSTGFSRIGVAVKAAAAADATVRVRLDGTITA